jgi:hypothetical protein
MPEGILHVKKFTLREVSDDVAFAGDEPYLANRRENAAGQTSVVLTHLRRTKRKPATASRIRKP